MGLRYLFALKPKKELVELYWFSLLYSFAASLILIFEPVFFYVENFSLAWIASYYAAHYILYLILLPWGATLTGRFGLERSLAISMPLFVVYFLTLAAIPTLPGLFYVSWILLALFKTFYWPAYHAEISKFGDKGNLGTEISWLMAINSGIGVLGPLIGGLVVTMFGFPVLFVIAAGLALFAGFPLLKTKERFNPVTLKYNKPWQILNQDGQRMVRWGMAGWGADLVYLVFWPIMMFTVLGTAGTLGLISSINAMIMTGLGFFVGEASDRMSRRKILRFHLPFMAIGYLLGPLAGGALRVFLTDTLMKASYVGVQLPMWHRLYRRARRVDPLLYATVLEMLICIYKILIALTLVAVFSMTTPTIGLGVTFIIAAVMSLFFVFI
ncbi:MAG: hypothetical protein A3I08_01605 [Candidatus Andersenbacteria bacterium RIFCSPLOWO2_02_FULL_46_11]|nr:MAG: Major facilitator superfamily [Parcubacteria group bacterium GW2011_GWA2_45_14]OGY34583.1 MAG: hypothetical protein A3B76_06350 [Candidatus Andersenbacteria bacterium RIFCSPHIGHO2_02_FULL_46_16]OGY37868.1 MAG: hypothetical protein A3I08_01605 [Candidatus Andersenbacteria bacterium RIFCSPLOWO2_02_FULL_46_11]